MFISYRRTDTAWAAVRLREGLTRRLDVDVFLDFKTLFSGVEFAEAINGSIDACDILIAVIGPNWFAASNDDGTRRIDNPKDWVRMEIARAFEQGKTVIPLTCDDAVMPGESWFPKPLRPLAGRQALELASKDYDPVIEGFAATLMANYGFEPPSADHTARPLDPVPEPEAGEDRDPRTLFFMGLETSATGEYRKAEGEFAEAAAIHVTIASIQKTAHGDESEDYRAIQHGLARAHLAQGKAAAEASWRDLLPVVERVKSAGDLEALAPIAARVMAATDPKLGYIAFLRAQCADALGDRAAVDASLTEAEANWGDRLTSEQYMRRELSAYLAERPGPA